MAKPVKFPEADGVRTAPVGMPDCKDLPVYCVGDGRLVSCWELSGEELMEVLKTKRVWLWVWGEQPPVSIDGFSPFEKPNGG